MGEDYRVYKDPVDSVPVIEYLGDYSEFEGDLSADPETLPVVDDAGESDLNDTVPVSSAENTLGTEMDYEALMTYITESADRQIAQTYILASIAFGVFAVIGVLLALATWRKL